MSIIKESYDSNYKTEKCGSYLATKYGFSGEYLHPLGIVSIDVTQDCKNNYYLLMLIIHKKRNWNRQIEFTQRPTQRHVSTLARRFIESFA